MNKNKKIILIITIIIAIIIVAVGACFIIKNYIDENKEGVSRLNELYNKLTNTNSYTFSITLDDNNKVNYAKQDNKAAYIDTYYKGQELKFIVKDGNTNLIKDENKAYYTFKNNETELYKIELQIRDIMEENQATIGKEKIDNKNYRYEEYAGLTDFYLGDDSQINMENVKTRFYFKKDKLVYVKTISDNNEQLVKIDYKDEVDNNLFSIPSDYKQM